MPPFAEFIGLHLMILSRGDAWANLVQWFALVQTMSAVSLICRDLGWPRRSQLLAALLLATLPMAVLQSGTPKNDLVVSFWLCNVGWWCVRLWTGRPWSLSQSGLFGSALGLLLLTKGTGYLFGLPVALLGGVGLLTRLRWRAVPAGALMVVAILLLNAGHVTRKYRAFGSVFGQECGTRNKIHSPAVVASNLLRNLALHLGTPSDWWNRRLSQAVKHSHQWLGIDRADPRSTFCPEAADPARMFYAPGIEDLAGTPIHVGLLLGLLVLLPLGWHRLSRSQQLFLLLSGACGLVFCVGLKWQVWHARLHLPLLCLFTVPLAGFCTSRIGRWVAPALVVGCLLALSPALRERGLNCCQYPFTLRSAFRPQLQSLEGAVAASLAGQVLRYRPASIGM